MYTQDQTPTTGEGIEAAMSLPPIPAPEILAPKRGWGGKVWNDMFLLLQVKNRLFRPRMTSFLIGSL